MTKIVIADDDPVASGLLRIALKNRYEILEASTGEDALAAAAADDVRLILLDVMMPSMTGREVSRRLRRNPLTCHIIIVIQAAAELNKRLNRVRTAGAGRCLTAGAPLRKRNANEWAVHEAGPGSITLLSRDRTSCAASRLYRDASA